MDGVQRSDRGTDSDTHISERDGGRIRSETREAPLSESAAPVSPVRLYRERRRRCVVCDVWCVFGVFGVAWVRETRWDGPIQAFRAEQFKPATFRTWYSGTAGSPLLNPCP